MILRLKQDLFFHKIQHFPVRKYLLLFYGKMLHFIKKVIEFFRLRIIQNIFKKPHGGAEPAGIERIGYPINYKLHANLFVLICSTNPR